MDRPKSSPLSADPSFRMIASARPSAISRSLSSGSSSSAAPVCARAGDVAPSHAPTTTPQASHEIHLMDRDYPRPKAIVQLQKFDARPFEPSDSKQRQIS